MRRRGRRVWRSIFSYTPPQIGVLGALSGLRWLMLRVLGENEKTTREIHDELAIRYGIRIPRTLLYYHLGELERMGIVEMKGYRETGRGGAPEKVWKLKIRRIIIDIPSGIIHME